MSKLHIKKGDRVLVLNGNEEIRGKEGKVLSVNPTAKRAVVEGLALVTKHQKPRRQGEAGGTFQKERALDVSNLMLVCPKCNKPTRAARRDVLVEDESGKKVTKHVRVCKKCNETIE